MSSGRKILCIIPARGGSKGIPGKNVRIVGGKPLLAHSIEHARYASAVTRIVVSTDDQNISRVATEYGAETVWRPPEISGDTASSESALVHVLNHLETTEKYIPDLVIFLQCTSPVRKREDVQRAIDTLDRQQADSLLSVNGSHRFLWRIEKEQPVSLNYDYKNRPRRQDRPPEYAENGSLYIFKPSILRTHNNRLGGKIALYEMDYWSMFEIDDLEDMALCDWILTQQGTVSQKPPLPADVGLVVLDFDGVLTDNRVLVLQDGQEAVICDRGDGLGLSLLRQAGVGVVVLSKEKNPVVEARCRKLNIPCHQGIDDKITLLKRILGELDLGAERVVYMGNDVNDLECMRLAGCAVAPRDAHSAALAEADWIISRPGGQGAVRELCDAILVSRGTR